MSSTPIVPVSSPAPLVPSLGTFVIGNPTVSIAPNRDVVLTFAIKYGGANGTPIAGARAAFSLVGPSNRAILGADDAMSADDGTVSVRLRAGDAANFRVRMDTEGSPPAFVDVNVSGVASGNVVARASYSGTDAISRVDVRLHDGRASCGAMASTKWPDGLPGTVQLVSVPVTSTDARFNNVRAGVDYTISSVAYAADGRVVATGCSAVTSAAQRDTIANTSLSPSATPPAPSLWERFLTWLGF
jgi:hypothetical protein